jgi:hypothetical protein
MAQEHEELLKEAGFYYPERAEHAYELPDVSAFSDDPALEDPIYVIGQMMRFPELWDPLLQATTDPVEWERRQSGEKHYVGQNRMDGDWLPVALHWVMDKQPQMQTWRDGNVSNVVWELAGFSSVPGRTCFWERITELEQWVPRIDAVTGKLWAIAREHDDRVNRHFHADGTPYESHAAVLHDCPDKELCIRRGGKKIPRRLKRLPLDQVDDRRHAEQAAAPAEDEPDVAEPEEDEELDLDESVLAEMEEAGEIEPSPHPKYTKRRSPRAPRGYREYWRSGHRYLIRDEDAGFRIYKSRTGRTKEAWIGGLEMPLIDDFLNIASTSLHIPADQSEFKAYPELLAKAVPIIGGKPEAVVGDRGLNRVETRTLDTELGIGDVINFRKPNASVSARKQLRRDGVCDEYGFTQCRYCGAPGATRGAGLGWRTIRGVPYILYRCSNPHTRECEQRLQKQRCSEHPTLLGVLSREDELYWELRGIQKNKEGTHAHSRARHNTSGRGSTSRAKRIGIPFMELRAAIARLLDIFRVCLRQGWLGEYERLNRAEARRRKGGREGVLRMQMLRRKHGLLVPWGAAARRVGLAWEGELPEGWVTLHEQRRLRKAAREAAANTARAGPQRARAA